MRLASIAAATSLSILPGDAPRGGGDAELSFDDSKNKALAKKLGMDDMKTETISNKDCPA